MCWIIQIVMCHRNMSDYDVPLVVTTRCWRIQNVLDVRDQTSHRPKVLWTFVQVPAEQTDVVISPQNHTLQHHIITHRVLCALKALAQTFVLFNNFFFLFHNLFSHLSKKTVVVIRISGSDKDFICAHTVARCCVRRFSRWSWNFSFLFSLDNYVLSLAVLNAQITTKDVDPAHHSPQRSTWL